MSKKCKIPGIYIEEIKTGAKAILGVSTSVCAFVGTAKRGPINKAISCSNFGDFEKRFGGLATDSEMSYAIQQFFNNGGTEALAIRMAKSFTISTINVKDEKNANVVLKIWALDEGASGNSIRIKIDYKNVHNGSFNLTVKFVDIYDPLNGFKEKFKNITLEKGHLRSFNEMVNNNSQLINGKIIKHSHPECLNIFLSGGSEIPFTDAEATIFYIGSRTKKEGIYALESTHFNLLCLPGISNVYIIANANTYCKERNAFMIIDSPKSVSKPEDLSTFLEGNTLPKTNNAAIYYPWLQIADRLNNGKLRSCPPSGTIAGIYARIDINRGVWKSPAGTDAVLNGVVDLEYKLSNNENVILNSTGVNCIRQFPTYGIVAWGARTLNGADAINSEYKYISVKRLALFIEESLNQGLKWTVFEPNNETLWSNINLNVTTFLDNLYRQGAFQGNLKEAYFVKCNRDTTTQNDINNGLVNILVGFAPLKPAEFIMLKIQQIAGQINS